MQKIKEYKTLDLKEFIGISRQSRSAVDGSGIGNYKTQHGSAEH